MPINNHAGTASKRLTSTSIMPPSGRKRIKFTPYSRKVTTIDQRRFSVYHFVKNENNCKQYTKDIVTYYFLSTGK